MDNERKTLHNRLTNKHKSHASELAWKRHHGSYMAGVRQRQRDELNSIYTDREENTSIYKEDKGESMNIKQINQNLKNLMESDIKKDNVFNLVERLSFANIAGGIAFEIDRDNNYVNLTTTLEGDGTGSYKSQIELDDMSLQQLYSEFKVELKQLCDNFDKELEQLLSKHGLSSTK